MPPAATAWWTRTFPICARRSRRNPGSRGTSRACAVWGTPSMDESTWKVCRIFTRPRYGLHVGLLGSLKEAVMNRFTAGILAAMTAVLWTSPAGAQTRSGADAMFEAARQKETLEGNLSGAIKEYGA